MPIVLLYHDVTQKGHDDASGFPGPGAAHYKLTPNAFCEHLDAIARAVVDKPSTDLKALSDSPRAWLLTFDDGGKSAVEPIADLLEAHGWRGLFFITTDCISKPTFVTPQQIRDLHGRGHTIGSHSCSHPERMSSCKWEQIVQEWQHSRMVLEDILGEPVTSASVPGGFYSYQVARAASQAGVKVLFNSEPTTSVFAVDGCMIVGRFSIVRGTTAQTAAALARGKRLPRLRQSALWKIKKITKAMGGKTYLRFRQWMLGRVYGKESDKAAGSEA